MAGGVQPFAEALAGWLRAALRDPEGRDRMSLTDLSRRAGVSRPTIYTILNGEGEETDQDTVTKLAAALAVDAPRITRVLDGEDGAPPSSPLALVKEAQALLALAAAKIDPTGPVQAAAAAHLKAERGSGPPRRKGRRPA